LSTESTNRRARVFVAAAGVVVAVLIVGAIVGVKMSQFKALGEASAQQTVPPQPVNATEVLRHEWQPRVTSVGSVVAVQGTIVRAELPGVVREIAFEAGSVVQKGDVLVRLDPDIERAQLREAEAEAKWAHVTYERAKNLIKSRSISQAELDEAQAAMERADARADSIRATMEKKVLRAPFTGKLGIRSISIGQFLEAGSEVVSLQAIDPVYVDFSVPQQQLGELREGLEVAAMLDAYPESSFHGKITAIESHVDAETRNVRVQATLPNEDGLLRPGMFVSVDVMLARSEDVLVIPATAVLHAPYGDSVFVIEKGEGKDAAKGEGKEVAKGEGEEVAKDEGEGAAGANAQGGEGQLVVRQQYVRLGERRGDYVVATEGVKDGEQVVSTGVFKLRSGMPVVVDNTLAPQFTFNPKPDNT
jgi:membrane fusion protein, multidrug efflux system